jgi:hypothetical protein
VRLEKLEDEKQNQDKQAVAWDDKQEKQAAAQDGKQVETSVVLGSRR